MEKVILDRDASKEEASVETVEIPQGARVRFKRSREVEHGVCLVVSGSLDGTVKVNAIFISNEIRWRVGSELRLTSLTAEVKDQEVDGFESTGPETLRLAGLLA